MTDTATARSPARQSPPVSFRNREIESELRERGDNPSQVALRELRRFFHLMDITTGEVARKLNLTPGQASFLHDVYEGSRFADEHTPKFSVLDVFTAANRYEVDGEAVRRLVSKLNVVETYALQDALERARHLPETVQPLTERLRLVGLLNT